MVDDISTRIFSHMAQVVGVIFGVLGGKRHRFGSNREWLCRCWRSSGMAVILADAIACASNSDKPVTSSDSSAHRMQARGGRVIVWHLFCRTQYRYLPTVAGH
jgi:hypothetical protein